MRILITDAFSSANRGDAAILDGILTGLRARVPDVELTVSSRFPDLTRRFHGVDAIDDRDPHRLMGAIDRADLVVGCGGSYLHDLYALNLHPRLATIHACARAGKPYVAFAQSIGPLDSPLSRTAARNALSDATWILVRDEASARIVRDLGVSTPVEVGVDAAVLGAPVVEPRTAAQPVLGVTVRSWHFPGVSDPAAAQARYEASVAEACVAWMVHTGGRVRFLSTCTSLGGYTQDDRVVARRVAKRIGAGVRVVEQDDLSFDVVRGQLASCDLVLGTRMHSLIFATTAGVPGVGIAYEFKTGEWLEQVGLGGLWRPIEEPRGLGPLLIDAWERRDELRGRIEARLPAIRARAGAQLDTLVAIAQGARPAAARPRATARGSWDQETWKYDVAHRRLRAVADAVVGEAAGGRVLDLGCSAGLLGRMIGPRFDYTGVDVAPSVAVDRPGFRIRTASLDGDWPVDVGADGAAVPFDVVIASGALEYVADLTETLQRARSVLKPGGLAVVTLFNLAHVSRSGGSSRHPTWRFDARPDELILHLREAGLNPGRVFASSAGVMPARAVDAEVPTDLDRAGAAQLPLPTLFRYAHHVVAVCRAVAPRPGLGAMQAMYESGDVLGALRLGVQLVKEAPWSARVWSDLAALWLESGDAEQARACLRRAAQLDPSRPGLDADRAALDLVTAEPAMAS